MSLSLNRIVATLGVTVSLLLAGTVVSAQPLPKHVAGKVVNVSQEKVQLMNAQNQPYWLDKVSVTVDDCAMPGKLTTVHYSPVTISDRTVLGHLFEAKIHSALTPQMIQQNMYNGYGVFWVDDQNKVLRTGILGHSVNCSAVPAYLQQFK